MIIIIEKGMKFSTCFLMEYSKMLTIVYLFTLYVDLNECQCTNAQNSYSIGRLNRSDLHVVVAPVLQCMLGNKSRTVTVEETNVGTFPAFRLVTTHMTINVHHNSHLLLLK